MRMQDIEPNSNDHGRCRKQYKLLRSVPLHSALVSLYPNLNLYAINIMFTPMEDIFRSMAVSLGLMLFLLFSFLLILRDAHRAGAICSLILFLFYSFGHCAFFIEGWAA